MAITSLPGRLQHFVVACSKEAKQVLADGSAAVYAAPDWLLFVRNGALWAQHFDTTQLN
jgi:hypothetical protein